MFLLNSRNPLVTVTHLSLLLGEMGIPSCERTGLFCRVPWNGFSQTPLPYAVLKLTYSMKCIILSIYAFYTGKLIIE
jgi:hypothetical protein